MDKEQDAGIDLFTIVLDVYMTPDGQQRTRVSLSEELQPGVVIQQLEMAKLGIFTTFMNDAVT